MDFADTWFWVRILTLLLTSSVTVGRSPDLLKAVSSISSSVLGFCEKHLLTTHENRWTQKLPEPSQPSSFRIQG